MKTKNISIELLEDDYFSNFGERNVFDNIVIAEIEKIEKEKEMTKKEWLKIDRIFANYLKN